MSEADRSRKRSFRLGLVAMPWAMFNRPSIQLGALKSYLAREEPAFAVRSFHPFLGLAGAIGPGLYHRIAQDVWLCEGLYAGLLFPERRGLLRPFLAGRLKSCGKAGHLSPEGLWEELSTQLDRWLAAQDWQDFDLVGFSVCFSQLLASLLAAARLKKIRPDLPIVFGGSSCVGEPGRSLLANFPQIDYLIGGEGELPLLTLCRSLAGKAPLGLDQGSFPAAAPLSQLPGLAALPIPDYDDYFAELRRDFVGEPFVPELPVEFSRGCWWRRCAFCNLNLQWQGYRGKSAERMLEEILFLAERHGCLDFFFADNVLPVRDSLRFFAETAASAKDLRFFAEIRVEQRGETLKTYRRGGLVSVQAGIEALSQSLLDRMAKGATVIDNLALMKEAAGLGIRLDGNLISEFPGSTEAEVGETLAALDFVLPFTPLSSAAFFLGYGSGVAAAPEQYGIRTLTHHRFNRKLFPPELLRSLSLLVNHYRGFESGEAQRQLRLWRPVREKIRAWQRFHAARPSRSLPVLPLSYRDGGSFLLIRQERFGQATLHHRLKGSSRAIYLSCEQVREFDELIALFPGFGPEKLGVFLEGLVAKRLLFVQGTRYLALAVPHG